MNDQMIDQDAVDFANWIADEEIHPGYKFPKGWYFHNGKLAAKSTEELYLMYLKSINQ